VEHFDLVDNLSTGTRLLTFTFLFRFMEQLELQEANQKLANGGQQSSKDGEEAVKLRRLVDEQKKQLEELRRNSAERGRQIEEKSKALQEAEAQMKKRKDALDQLEDKLRAVNSGGLILGSTEKI
jgi:seryl-tRNA synthetase